MQELQPVADAAIAEHLGTRRILRAVLAVEKFVQFVIESIFPPMRETPLDFNNFALIYEKVRDRLELPLIDEIWGYLGVSSVGGSLRPPDADSEDILNFLITTIHDKG